MGSTVLVIDTSRHASCRNPDDGGERSSSISSSSTTQCSPSSFQPASTAFTNVSTTGTRDSKTEGLMWQIEEYLSHFHLGRATSKARRPARLKIEIYPEKMVEQALASSPDALRFNGTAEHDLLSPFCFRLQTERVEDDVAPFPYTPGGESDEADHLERQLLRSRLDGDTQIPSPADVREHFQTTLEPFCCDNSSQIPAGPTETGRSLDTPPPSTKIIQDLRKATKLKKLLGDEVDPHLPTSVVPKKPQQHPILRRSYTSKPLPLLPLHQLHRSDTAVTMPELVHLGNRAMLGSYKPRDKKMLHRLDSRWALNGERAEV